MLREEVFSPLAHTCAQFASLLHTLLGKGSRHAALLWSDWHRRGALLGDDPAFANASALKAALLTHICPSLPAIVHSTEEGGARKFLLSVGEGLALRSAFRPRSAARWGAPFVKRAGWVCLKI
jgi:23S rRNA (adenine2503-C2)-methyltransferase